MPIDYKKYPPNWKTEIRPAVLKRANNSCEFCGVENHSIRPDGTKVVLTIAHLDHVEDSALEQVTKLCNSKDYCENRIRIMPDCHSGKGCVIGTTIALDHKVDPNLVGVDVGCGMLVKSTRNTLTRRLRG